MRRDIAGCIGLSIDMKYIFPIVALLLFPTFTHAQDCQGSTLCTLDGRSYHIRIPDDWDGETALPVLLHFHGWGRQGDLIVKHQRISGHTRRRGVLLVAPSGRGRTWDFRNPESSDVPFAAAVIEDVAENLPIDRSRIYVSGYSYGAAMAWRYVCQNGDGVAALLAISGTLRHSENCPQGPREVRQVYGFDDDVMRLDFSPGRNETLPVDMWRDLFDCKGAPVSSIYKVVDWLAFDRGVWSDCAQGRKVTLDLHDGGHFIPHGWIGWQLDQLLGRVPSYP